MTSAEWFARRRRWQREEQARRDGAVVMCAGRCGREWTLDDDLHHVTYARLGQELHEDLLGLCRDCHEALHLVLDRSRAVHQLLRSDPVAVTARLLERIAHDRA